jgi:hypothetical protein
MMNDGAPDPRGELLLVDDDFRMVTYRRMAVTTDGWCTLVLGLRRFVLTIFIGVVGTFACPSREVLSFLAWSSPLLR